MNIEVIAIGNEILSGATTNSNATFISEQLTNAGYPIHRHTVLPDDADVLLEGLKEALKRSSIVLTTGGLGPTCDDITRAAAAEIFESEFHYDEEIAAELKQRYGDRIQQTLENQATVPTKAKVLKNEVGTAPGLIFSNGNSILILMPGVPPEMKTMLVKYALPYIKKTFPLIKNFHIKRLNLFNIPEAAVDPLLRELKQKHPEADFGIYPGQGILNVVIKSNNQESFNECCEAIAAKFASNLFESSTGRLEDVIHERFINKKLTLSSAESCTGGSFAEHLIQLPGASKYFLGSIVAYSNELKKKFLGVTEEALQAEGAVSQRVVSEMVQGALERTGSDYAVAVSGIAGPEGGTPQKPVGTVWCGVGRKGEKPYTWKIHAFGNREMVIERSVNALLAQLYTMLHG